MENDDYLVSICIATYNRCSYLKDCLESIVCQKEFLDGLVEICISDNHCDDGTEELCKEYLDRYKNINYYRQSETINPGENQSYALEMGKGKLLKLSNDTLLYVPGSLKVFCDIAKKYYESRPFLFFINENTECRGAFSADEYVNGSGKNYDFEEFLYNISYWITFIGYYAYWRDGYKGYNSRIEGYETEIRQVFFACEILEDQNDSIIVSDHLFENQGVSGKNLSYGLYKVFYNNYLTIMEQYREKGDFSKECYEFLKHDVLTGFFPIWVVRWEFNKGEMRFSEEENLKELIFKACKDNGCYGEYLEKYKILKKDFTHAKIKKRLYELSLPLRKLRKKKEG